MNILVLLKMVPDVVEELEARLADSKGKLDALTVEVDDATANTLGDV